MGVMAFKGAALLLGLYVLVLGVVWWGQERLLFHPQTLSAQHRFALPADVHETWVDVPGAKLHALHLRNPQAQGLVFYLHGNTGNVETWFVNSDFYRQQNLDLFVLDYRGFGKSSGRIQNEAQLHADVMAAWQSVATLPAYAGKRRIIFGRSLGTGLAAQLSAHLSAHSSAQPPAQRQPDLTVLVSPYSSMLDMADDHYPWVPKALSRYALRTDQFLRRVKGPVLLIHGGIDTLIAPAHSQRLKALVPHAELLLLPQAGHGDLQAFSQYSDALKAAFAAAFAATPQKP
jgi:uncharacterized protein